MALVVDDNDELSLDLGKKKKKKKKELVLGDLVRWVPGAGFTSGNCIFAGNTVLDRG